MDFNKLHNNDEPPLAWSSNICFDVIDHKIDILSGILKRLISERISMPAEYIDCEPDGNQSDLDGVRWKTNNMLFRVVNNFHDELVFMSTNTDNYSIDEVEDIISKVSQIEKADISYQLGCTKLAMIKGTRSYIGE